MLLHNTIQRNSGNSFSILSMIWYVDPETERKRFWDARTIIQFDILTVDFPAKEGLSTSFRFRWVNVIIDFTIESNPRYAMTQK